jgi:hypothetical protein
MRLPIRVFWQISGMVPRLLASEKKETLEVVTTATHNPEAASELFRKLSLMAPEPVTVSGAGRVEANSARDEAGFDELRAMR